MHRVMFVFGVCIAVLLAATSCAFLTEGEGYVVRTTSGGMEGSLVETAEEKARGNNGGEDNQDLEPDIAESEERIDTTSEAEGIDDVELRKIKAQEAIDEALVFLDQSRGCWERGELESALAILDEAYALTLGINDDPDIAWQRDDLRFLIAKRIIEIYASRSTVAAGKQSEIPLSDTEEVRQEIRRFQGQEREFFVQSYRRSGAYRDMIAGHLREAGLPEELSWLPLVESGFSTRAFSSARALGLWQFIPSTGYKFGLKRDQFIDERMDPEKSTLAAIEYLTELHGIFGDWNTALAAYNCGEGRVLRVISQQRINYLDNFWDLYRQLPGETRSYVPRFLATLMIVNDPETYGFDLENIDLDEPIPYETVVTDKCMRLSDIAKGIDVTEQDLEFLNSELRLKATPDGPYELKIPAGKKEILSAVMDKIPATPVMVVQVGPVIHHKVRKGETLSVIARRYGTTVSAIARANNISQRHIIRAGRTLSIPVGKSQYTAGAQSSLSKSSRHRVRRGETLSSIALRYGCSVDALVRANDISHRHMIREGQVLIIPGREAAVAYGGSVNERLVSHTVQKGDSLFYLARRYNTTVSRIKAENNMGGNLIRVGQELRIPTPVPPGKISPGSADGKHGEKTTYQVQSGDSPYTIARRFNVDLDHLLETNGLARNDRIFPGQELIIVRH